MTMQKLRDLGVHLVVWMLIFSAVSIFYVLFPTPEIDGIVHSYPGQISVIVGGRDGFSGSKSYHRRNFFLIPSVFYDPKVITVRKVDGDAPEVTEDKEGFLFVVTLVVISATLYFRKRWRKDDA